MTRDAVREELGAAVRGILRRDASEMELEGFSRYIELLRMWNRVQRLTAFDSPAEIARHLLRDALLFHPLLPPRPTALADIGSGAGVPGVPLRIVDGGISLTLIEARRKRVSFLRALQRELKLSGARILHGRAEEMLKSPGSELSGAFDVVVARAVSPLATLVPLAMPLLREGGVLIASRPPGDGAPPQPSLPFHVELRQLSFPSLGLARSFVIVKKEVDLTR